MSADAPLGSIDLHIKLRGSEGFKSISNLTWNDIPGFAILTGRNGSGKSQLLLFLAHALNQATDSQYPDLDKLSLEISGDTFRPGETSYVPNSGGYIHDATLAVGNLHQAKQQAIKNLRQSSGQPNIYWRKKLRWAMSIFGEKFHSLSEEQLIKEAPDDLRFMLEDDNVLYGLVHVFLAYRLQTLQELENDVPKHEIRAKLGPAPWEVLNEILSVADFPYRVEAPKGSLLDPYNFELKEGNIAVNPKDLSSGEKVILQLALWLYDSRHHNRFPRLFLMDEPDAHLHPSMTRQFMNVVQEVLVNRYKVRVILTTHSPSTVALAPEGSIFEMTRGANAITRSKSKADTIGLLTAGLVVVSATTRFVLAEDEADVDFYSTVRDILSEYGPSKDAMALSPAPTIVFLPASTGQGANKIGGKSVV